MEEMVRCAEMMVAGSLLLDAWNRGEAWSLWLLQRWCEFEGAGDNGVVVVVPLLLRCERGGSAAGWWCVAVLHVPGTLPWGTAW